MKKADLYYKGAGQGGNVRLWDNIGKEERFLFADDKGRKVSSQTFMSELEEIAENIPGRCLVFILCENSIGAIMGYIAMIRSHIVPLLLEKDMDPDCLINLLDEYEPSFLWFPEGTGSIEGYGEVVFRRYGYKLLKRNQVVVVSMYSELALLMSTSGSTGSPKLVRISYEALRDNALSIAEYLKISSDQKPITTLPMNYVYGLSVLNSHLVSGASILVTDKTILQKEFWDFFNREKATSIAGVPYFYEMLDKLGFYNMDLPSLETMTQAGGKLSEKLQIRFGNFCKERGCKFFIMYGQAEATARISYLPAEKCLEKIGSVGIPIPGGCIRLVNEKGERIQEADKEGELVYRGRNVMLGYAEEASDLCLGDQMKGELYTGDVAKRDEDGFYYIVGRKKRMIKLNGKRYSLDEIEKFINGWAGERVCACIGTDDALEIYLVHGNLKGETVALLERVFKINQKKVKTRICRTLPMTLSGKICYAELKNTAL